MARLLFENEGCRGATSGISGRHYNADKQGFITVTDQADIKNLKSGGYIEAGGMPRTGKYWLCEDCDWEAALNHCRYCGSESLRRVEA